ncbi:MAG: hypothetical protein J0L92_12240, partial [Deltaproteobacteria bacterium]|nr:hypothetical protein [Deltaproteobacteria bacterium]
AAKPAASTSRTDPSVPAVKSGDRLSVAPIVGVGVRRSSRPPAGRAEPPTRDRARPIVEPIVDSPPSELPPPVSPRVSSAGIDVREPIATPASELPAAIEAAQIAPAQTSAAQIAPAQTSAAQNDRRAPRLRGPLTAGQAAKLLEDASDRDGIVAVFFAFARQFFDYAALFTLQDDRAEGRDAFGEGASAARIRAVSLTIAGDEDSLLASARKSGAPQLGALSTAADLDLASVLVRPRNTFALAYPVVIRGRPVLVLYGDRGGDRFELSDVPELVGFVRRVADALEKLILRRKRDGVRGRFEKPKGEEREDLKSSASAMRSSTHPPAPRPGSGRPSDARGRRREDVWSTPKLGAVVPEQQPASGPSLADALAKAELPMASSEPPSGVIAPPIDGQDDLASRALDDATADAPLRPAAERTTLVDLVPARAGSAEPASANEAFRPTEELTRVPSDAPVADGTPGRRVARKQQTMRDVLGIPRAAPPPPVVGDIFDSALDADPANEVMLGATDALAPESLGDEASDADSDDVRGPNTIPVPPPDLGDDSPELVVGDRGDDDSEPELVVGAGDSDDDGGEDEAGDDDDDQAGDEAPIELKRRASPSYILRDAGVDVFEQVSSRNSQPPARKRSVPPGAAEEIGPSAGRRPDPRREEDATGPFELVAKPQRGIGAMSKSAVIEPREFDGTRPTHDRENPSVIVDMGEAANTLVEDLMHADPEGDTPVVDSLLKLGETALPALAQAFPGPLWFDRRRNYRKLPRGRDVSAVSRALVAFRERAAPYVGALVGAGAPDRRFYAIMVASEIPSGALVDPLVQRVFDEDAGVRALVLEVLPKFRAFAEVQDQLVFLRRTARIRGKEPVRRLYALAALAALRDAGGLRTLVDLLEDEDAGVRRASHGALVAITCEDLGESARRWAAWSEKNESRHRIEWLIDALLSSEESLRAQAGEELKTITQQYFGYHPAASRKEREVVQTKYRHWWDREGRALFK